MDKKQLQSIEDLKRAGITTEKEIREWAIKKLQQKRQHNSRGPHQRRYSLQHYLGIARFYGYIPI